MILDTTDNRITEIIKDAYELDSSNKKEIIEKYDVPFTKLKDIKQYLYDLGDSYRKEHKTYSKEDWSIWNRKWDAPSSMKKIREACEDEPIEWIDFCIEVTKKKAYPKDFRNDYFIKLKNEQETKSDSELQNIYDRLTILTFPFKETMYKHCLEQETIRYNWFLTKKFDDEVKKHNPRLYAEYIRIKYISNGFDWETFKNHLDEEFERMFCSNIKAIANRIRPLNINSNKLKLVNITEDPKFFEMVLRDNLNRTIHCRSIIAAESSNIVRTHYRFIITIKKPK